MELKPFVKWAGGKTQLLKRLLPLVPEFDTYYEPFVGGGAMLFTLQPKKAVIADTNKPLYNAYQVVRSSDVVSLINTIDMLETFVDDETNYRNMRATFNAMPDKEESDTAKCALFFVLNRRCYNGLFRVNSKGEFNVPWGKNVHKGKVDKNNLLLLHDYLNSNSIDINLGDFEEQVKRARENDFVFFDSPYIPTSKTAGFTRYTTNDFKYEDHVRLANVYKELSERGVKCLLTNSNTPLAKELYKDYHIREVNVMRAINSDVSKRVGREIIVTNYEV